MNSKLKILCSLPKTIWFNLRYLPFNQALKLPVWISFSTSIHVQGKVILEGTPSMAMIRVGFHTVDACEKHATTALVIRHGGKLVFKGTAHIGNGSRLCVDGGVLELGDNFAISASSTINCFKHMVFGRDIQFSWDCLVMDSDTHSMCDVNGRVCNEPKEIIFGDKIWIGCRCTVMKGTVVPSNCVIGACSFLSGAKFEEYSIIAGSPAKSIRKIGGWTL